MSCESARDLHQGEHGGMWALGQHGGHLAVVALLLLACGTVTVRDVAAPVPRLAGYAAEAIAHRAYTAARLAHYGGAADCAAAPFVAYARSDVDDGIADAWY